MNYIIKILCLLVIATSCKKLIEIPEPSNSLTTSQLFASDNEAVAAVMGIYSQMSYGDNNIRFASGGITILAGLSADELHIFNKNSSNFEFETNAILITNGTPLQYFWGPIYSAIYKANATLEGLKASTKLTEELKNQLSGEVKFLRAFCYFYLINLFGDVPLVTTSSWTATAMMSRTAVTEVYQQIIADLQDARNSLITDYSSSNEERIRANKYAASALLSRVYLYMRQWTKSEEEAMEVINNTSLYKLVSLDSVFLKNNNEAIWQLQPIDRSPWATREGNQFVTRNATSSPNYFLSSPLLASFELEDLRKIAWTKTTVFPADTGTTYYYPYKYKIRQGSSGNLSEYYTLLRLAEQYLISAEAKAQQNKLSEAISDLNKLRFRAGLSDLPSSLTQTEVLDAVYQERRTELFAEWGHRWLDLKRTGQADAILSQIKSHWQTAAKLYPIPPSELQVNPYLTQNPGY